MFLRLLIFTLFLSVMNTFAQTPPIETGISNTLAKWREARYSDVRYKLNLTLEKGAPTLKGTIEIRVKLSEPPALAGGANAPLVVLDWRKIRGKEDLSTVSNVSLNNKPLTLAANPPANAGGSDTNAKFEEINEHLVFKDGVIKGENVIKLDFTSPILTSGGAVTRYVDKEDNAEYIYSLFVPSDASTAFPVFDQPDLKARFSLSVYVRGKNRRDFPDWKVISNSGESIGFNSTWGTLHTFAETKPISTYVFAFAAGDFDEYCAGFPIPMRELKKLDNAIPPLTCSSEQNIYVRKSQAEKFKQHAAETFRLNREAVKYLESYFDYKFPFPKYDLVLIPEFPFGGMEHAGATFLREDRVIFPTEPTKNDYVTRANLIFHEAVHQWFGDTVTMKWFDDLWLKEGFAEFMAYKTLEKVMPEYNAWKIFYERNKQAAYLTDSTKGTTPIYQEIPNLASAKSAYGNIVYRKAPSFLKQAEFYLGADKFQIAVRVFLKKHEFANAEWTDLVKEFETASGQDLKDWANVWVTERGMPVFRMMEVPPYKTIWGKKRSTGDYLLIQKSSLENSTFWREKTKVLIIYKDDSKQVKDLTVSRTYDGFQLLDGKKIQISDGKVVQTIEGKLNVKSLLGLVNKISFVFPNYEDYGYGIFLLDEKSRAYVLANIQTEKDDFLRTMMWGALWDSVRETELNPKDYVELVIKNINVESDESTIQTLLGRVSTAMNYYLSEPSAVAGGLTPPVQREKVISSVSDAKLQPSATADGSDLAAQLETLLIDKMQNAPTLGQRITFYRAFLNIASSEKARTILKDIKSEKLKIKDLNLKLKDRYDILIRLGILGDKDATQEIYKKYTTQAMDQMSDEERRYAFASGASIADAEIKKYYFDNFVSNKNISENWIEAAFVTFNSVRHAELTLPYLEKALAELPNLKRTRKIFFVNGWLSAFIGGQKSEQALAIINKFLVDNPNLDKDLRLKILENADNLERAVKIRQQFGR